MSESKTPCSHEYVRTWHDTSTGELVELWSCADCMIKFVPITNELRLESDLASAQADTTRALSQLDDALVRLQQAHVRIAELEAERERLANGITILRHERNDALLRRDALMQHLCGIHALIQPPHVVLPDGRRMQCVPPLDLLVETWGALSKAIREIPDVTSAAIAKEKGDA